MEGPLHPTPMQRPMMKGKIYVDASNKPTFQGIWGMTHADVNKGGHTNDFKVVRMESVREDEIGLPVFAGHYLGYFKLTTGFQTETVNESFTLTFRGHSNHGYNVYGFGENRFGKNEIVGTVTQTGKMEIFKMDPGTTSQPDPNEPQPKLPRPANARAASPPPPPIAMLSAASPRAGGGGGTQRPKSGGSSKKKSSSKSKNSGPPPAKGKTSRPPPPPSKNGLPGLAVRTLKECLAMLRKGDKGLVFQSPVPPHFRGLKGMYCDVIRVPMDLGTVAMRIDSKYRNSMECIEDVRLVFSNAKIFNPDTDPVHALAASLSGKFEAFLSNHRVLLGLDANGQLVGASQSKGSSSSSASDSMASRPGLSAAGNASGPGVVKGDGGVAKAPKAGASLTVEEQDKLARDVNELFRVGNANPSNERAQARVYALWSFAKAYVADKDRVLVDGGKGAEIRMDALNHMRQRQLRDVVAFFLEDSKKDPPPREKREKEYDEDDEEMNSAVHAKTGGRPSDGGDTENASSGGARKRGRSDLSDSDEEDDDDDEDAPSPGKRSRGDSVASAGSKRASLEGAAPADDGEGEGEGGKAADKGTAAASGPGGSGGGLLERVDSSRLTLEATASKVKETEIDIDLEDEDEDDDDDDEDDGHGGHGHGESSASGDGSGSLPGGNRVDAQWTQAQIEKREMENREKKRAASEKALEEQRLKQQAQRERERVEEGLKLSRERAAEKARLEAAALEKLNREKKELAAKKEAERIAREESKADVDLDQVRGNSQLMDMMDASVYDD